MTTITIRRHCKGFILPSGMTLYAALGALVVIGLLSAAVWVQSARLEAKTVLYEAFVAKVKLLGETAEADKQKKEQEHGKILTDVSTAWKNSIDATVANAVARYRLRNNNPGSRSGPGAASDPKALDGASQEPLACQPDESFIRDCAADAAKIDSFQTWGRSIGFPVK